jgi:deoxyribodipyrimidine photo-lyase
MHIFLFHRDLRLVDNTTLIHQLQKEKTIVPIFIFPPEQIDKKINKYFSNNSVQFMIESLYDLSNEIKSKSGKMYFFKGDNITVLKKIHKIENIESIGFNIDYTPYAIYRDKEIENWCSLNDIQCYSKEDYVLYDILTDLTKKKDKTPYLVFTPFKNHCLNDLEVRQIDKFNKFKFYQNNDLTKIKYNIDESEINNFYKENSDINVHGGRKNGLKILSKIDKFKDYTKKRDNLIYNTTFLSAHNHFSTVSIREVYYAVLNKLGIKSGLINELHWRDFYVNITFAFPKVLQGQIKGNNKSFKEKYDDIKWSYNKKLFDKWCNGETGFPLIDAGMKQLNQTGFLHNRNRMCVASFLTKDLHIDWKLGEKYFATKLVDYDPMSNSGGWLWVMGGGCDAQPYFRIFNPWTQQKKYDPDCEYIKKWIPELNDIPNKDIHNWFKSEIHNKWLTDNINYYVPIINHDVERLETLKIYKKSLK